MNMQRLFLPAMFSAALVLVACHKDEKKPEVNHVPLAEDLQQNTQADTELKGLLKAQDSDGDGLSFALASSPGSGTVAINSDGSFSYLPKADTTGTDQFTYTVSDGQVVSAPATVKITIHPLEVNFSSYSRKVYGQATTATPLPLDTRQVKQDVTDPTAYDDLLQ